MMYYSDTKRELSQFSPQENELAIYTGTGNPRDPGTLHSGVNSKNAYVYIWQDGQPLQLDACFCRDRVCQDVLNVQAGGETYSFLRDKASGYIRQISGSAKPIIAANLGAIPLRVDTFLGQFTVHAGTMLRLDKSVPQREKKKVLLTIGSQPGQPIKSAEIWEGAFWRKLNIRKTPLSLVDSLNSEVPSFAVLDGRVIVQHLEVIRKREFFMMDSPEPNPDYEIYVFAEAHDQVTLRFSRTDYRNGRVMQRLRTIPHFGWGKTAIYDLQKLRESLVRGEMDQCTAKLPRAPDIFKLPELTAGASLPDDQTGELAQKEKRPLISAKQREFLESEDTVDERPLASEKADVEYQEENHVCGDTASPLREQAQSYPDEQKASVPEPPEDFPE